MTHVSDRLLEQRKKARMHIALVINDLGGGGAERSILNLTSGLIGQGHRVDLLLFRRRIDYAKEVPKEARLFVMGKNPDRSMVDSAEDVCRPRSQASRTATPLDWTRLANACGWDPFCLPHRGLVRDARAVAWYLERENPDCVLPNLPRPIAITLLGSRLLKGHPPPIIPTIHNFVESRRPRDQRRSRHLFPYASHFVGVSRGVSDNLSVTMGVSSDRITTIYNPVVTPGLHVKMAEPPSHPWVLDGGEPVVLAAGRLVEQKDYPTLLKAFGRLAARRPCRLIILGEGKRRRELEELIGELDLTDRVSLPGWVENPFVLMSRAALFVLSSIHEGLPTVLVEAMACGCPCVSTDCPAGPAEILEDGRYGPLVPVGDETALAEAMGRVLDQPPEKPVLRQRAADFSVERAVDAYEQLIGRLVSYDKCGTDSVR